jgi:hypothetical protein
MQIFPRIPTVHLAKQVGNTRRANFESANPSQRELTEHWHDVFGSLWRGGILAASSPCRGSFRASNDTTVRRHRRRVTA